MPRAVVESKCLELSKEFMDVVFEGRIVVNVVGIGLNLMILEFFPKCKNSRII